MDVLVIVVDSLKALFLRYPSQRPLDCDSKLCDNVQVPQHSVAKALQLLGGAPYKTICWWNNSLSLQIEGWRVRKACFQRQICT